MVLRDRPPPPSARKADGGGGPVPTTRTRATASSAASSPRPATTPALPAAERETGPGFYTCAPYRRKVAAEGWVRDVRFPRVRGGRPDPLRDRGAALPRVAALRWADIETADGSVVAVAVTVRRSKTNQAGDPPAGGGRAGRGRCGHRSRRRPGEPPALRPACAAAGLEHGRYPWIPPKIGRPDGRNRALMDPEPSPPLRRARPRLAKSLSIARLPRRQPPREPATPQALSRRSEPTSYG